jgi:hypothetical protein
MLLKKATHLVRDHRSVPLLSFGNLGPSLVLTLPSIAEEVTILEKYGYIHSDLIQFLDNWRLDPGDRFEPHLAIPPDGKWYLLALEANRLANDLKQPVETESDLSKYVIKTLQQGLYF